MALTSGLFNAPATKTANEPIATVQPVGNKIPLPTEWTLEGDPNYQASIRAAGSQFRADQANALAQNQYQATDLNQRAETITRDSLQARKELAGNFAARGMAGGAAGALTYAQAEANARDVTARTSLIDQIAELNKNWVSTYGAVGTDWQGTLRGQAATDAARQQAIAARLQAIGANQ